MERYLRKGVLLARTLAAILGTLCLLNTVVAVAAGRFNANLWWIDLRALPLALRIATQLLAGGVMVYLAIGRGRRVWVIGAVRIVLGLLIVVSLFNSVVFYRLLAHGEIHSDFPIPFSLAIAGVLAILLRETFRFGNPVRTRVAIATFVVAAIAFPLGQMFLYGLTDYSRPADAIVVFGARTYADGRPSPALADRVITACELYHAGVAPRLIFSGGPGDGPTDEPHAMRNLAISLDVPASAITLDPNGLNTAATVRNTVPLLADWSVHRVVAVSHFYHLPRVKLSYEQAGLDVYTVPAKQGNLKHQMPFLMAREIAALWVYYLRGIA
jgi:uncharacterized SAM-binding protein YcdF (DUF218 family)